MRVSSRLPALAPEEDLEREQGPESVSVVACARLVLGEHCVECLGNEVLLHARVGSAERGGDVVTQVLAEPAIERHAETALGAIENLVGQQVLHGGLEL